MRKVLLAVFGVALVSTVLVGVPVAASDTDTPRPMVDTYDSLADAILANKQTEWNLVHTILASAYHHAEGLMQQARMEIEGGKDARKTIESLAGLVAQIGNEGDASVAAIRKRLVESGHHHHSSADQQGEYDPGFVIVTREAKKGFIDSSKAIARLAANPDGAALEAEWGKVKAQFQKLHPGSH